MFAAERRARIKDIVIEYKHVTIAALSEMLQVTEATVRRDLEMLEQEGVLHKMHGGAVLNEESKAQPSVSPYTPASTVQNLHGKQEIAKVAAMLIKDGDTMFIGGGTTCTAFANSIAAMPSIPSITVVSNSLHVVNALSGLSPIRLICTGGELNSEETSYNYYGTFTMQAIGSMFFPKVFFSVSSVSLKHGFMCDSGMNVELLKKVLQQSSDNYVLADHTKFNKVSMLKICNLTQVQNIVTNEQIPDEYKTYFYDQNIKVFTTMNYPSENY